MSSCSTRSWCTAGSSRPDPRSAPAPRWPGPLTGKTTSSGVTIACACFHPRGVDRRRGGGEAVHLVAPGGSGPGVGGVDGAGLLAAAERADDGGVEDADVGDVIR